MTHAAPRLALVIDDDPNIREILRAILETAEFEVHTMSDGIDALELKEDYGVILLDLKMPIFDATRLTDYWRLTAPGILTRVILLTGYSRLSSDHDLGTFATVAKPFDFRHLLEVVERCIHQPRASSS